MATDAEYLKALADELMCPCMEADLGKEDGRRLYRIADVHDKLVAALTFVVNREHLMCAECLDADEILAVCRAALAEEEGEHDDS